MDPELIAYLDQRFRETAQQISALREETMERFDQVDHRFEQVDHRFEQVDRRFEQVDRRFEQVDHRFEQVEATNRQTLVMVEGLRTEIHLIAEAFLGLDDKMGRFQSEAKVVFDTVRGWIEPYYRELDGRIRTLETQSHNLDDRVRFVEGRVERQNVDVLDAVRKVLGKPPRASTQ